MNERFEYQGNWWLPNMPEEQVPGILKFDPDYGATLDLLGLFNNLQNVSDTSEPEIILGLSSDGKSITLKDCVRDEAPLSFGGFPTSTFSAETVLIGEYFERAEDVGFERLIIDYKHLDAWAGSSGFEIEMIDDPETHPIVVRHEIPDPTTARVGDEYEVALFFGSNRKWSVRPVTEVSLTQPAELVVRFTEKQPLDHLMDIAYRLQHLLSLGTRRSVYPVAMWGATGSVGEAIRVEIHYRSLGRIGGTIQKRPKLHEMLFALRDLPEGFGPAVARWLERAEVLDPVYRLYLGTVYNPNAFIEQQFLYLVQALESYHRRAMSTPEMQEDEHEGRKTEILEAVPEHHREWLGGKLQYSNEPSLRKRLKEIIRRYPESATPIAGGNSRERERFVSKVVDTRNYRTHFDESLEEQAARGEELHPINQKLKQLLEMSLMGEIGFGDDEIRRLLSGIQ